MHRVAVIAVEGVVTFDLAIPCQTLGFPFSTLGVSGYDTRVCAATPGLLPTSTGLCVDIPHGLDTVDDAATVIVPGIQDLDNVAPQGVLQAIQAAHQRGARLVSICTGAFVLAAAGVLDGRPATTHWSAAERLAQRYPAVRIDPRPDAGAAGPADHPGADGRPRAGQRPDLHPPVPRGDRRVASAVAGRPADPACQAAA